MLLEIEEEQVHVFIGLAILQHLRNHPDLKAMDLTAPSDN